MDPLSTSSRPLYLKLPIIVDLGSGDIKAGFNGTEICKLDFPN